MACASSCRAMEDEALGRAGGSQTSSGDETEGSEGEPVADPNRTLVVFECENVFAYPSRDRVKAQIQIPGRLSLVKRQCNIFLAWLPYKGLDGEGANEDTLQDNGNSGRRLQKKDEQDFFVEFPHELTRWWICVLFPLILRVTWGGQSRKSTRCTRFLSQKSSTFDATRLFLGGTTLLSC